MKISVIIPVFNEEKTVGQLIKKVLKVKLNKEIIIIDDGSDDNTPLVIKQIVNKKNSKKILKIFSRKKNKGKGAAIRYAFKKTKCEVVIIQDADLEYDPRDYFKLIEPIIKKRADVVYGTRLKTLKFNLFGKNKTPLPLHYLANRILSKITNLLYGANLTDMETGYKVMTKKVYKNLNLKENGFGIEPEITGKIILSHFKIVEVPIKTQPRSYEEGKKITWKDGILAFYCLLKYRL